MRRAASVVRNTGSTVTPKNTSGRVSRGMKWPMVLIETRPMKTKRVDVFMGSSALQSRCDATQLSRYRRGCRSARLYLGNEFLDAASIRRGFRFGDERHGALLHLRASPGTDVQPSLPRQFAIRLRHGIEMNADIER